MRNVFVRVVVILGLGASALVATPAVSAAEPTNGPFLYSHFLSGKLKTTTGEQTELGFPVDPLAAFSPDGALVASASVECLDDNCSAAQTTVTVHGNDGSTTTLTPVPGIAGDIAWSPDQSQVALMVGFGDAEIWRVGLDGSAPVQVLASSDSFRVEDSGLDWSPTADTIAFVGTPLNDDGSSWAIDTRQIYTVGAEGGAPSKFSAQLAECEFPDCRMLEYSEPAYSPDGSQIAAFVDDDYENFDTGLHRVEEYVGRMAQGQLPTEVRMLQTLENPGSWSGLRRLAPDWSSDGASLVYGQYTDQDGLSFVSRVVALDGSVLATLTDPDYRDWQPCPSGICAPWGAPPEDCTIEGTDGDDRLEGTAEDDVICGYGGNDVLIGGGGADVLLGGDGEDDLVGGPGDDVLEGGPDADALRGDAGDDLISGGAGPDLVTYFTSKSPVVVDLGKQLAKAGPHGNDKLLGIEGAFGSKTKDQLIGSSAGNQLYGGPGDDVLKGMGGTDTLTGNAGADRLLGGGGGDLLEGSDGKDQLNGGAARDACYDDSATRKSCEVGAEGLPKRGKPPVDGEDSGEIAADDTLPRGTARMAGGYARWWNIGNGDFVFVYDRVATQNLASWASTPSWESRVCWFVRYSPARGACSAAGVLNAVSKYQMQWFLWNAQRSGGCAIGILDWGHHGVNQFKKRWKTRPATYYRYKVAIPYVTPGRATYVQWKGGGFPVSC